MNRARELFQQTINDPALFAKTVLRHQVWRGQATVLRAVRDHRRVLVKACHSSSKTFAAAELVLWWLFRRKDAIVLTTAPTSRQAEALLWGEVRKTAAQDPPPRIKFPSPRRASLKLREGNYALGFTTSAENAGVNLHGFHSASLLIIIDEAVGIDGPIWDALEGARAGGDVHLLVLCNPTVPSGPVYQACTRDRARWKIITVDAFDTPNLSDFSLDDLRALPSGLDEGDPVFGYAPWPMLVTRRWVYEQFHAYGEESAFWQSRVRAQFPTEAQDALLPLAWLEAAARRRTGRRGDRGLTAGIDVAGPGECETVVAVREGDVLIDLCAWRQADPRGAALNFLNRYRDSLDVVNVDASGIGYNFGLFLQDQGFQVRLVNVGAAATDAERFYLLKAEYYWGLRERLRDNALAGLADEQALAQLASLRYRLNPRGQVAIESKEEARKRGVSSPDRAEAIMLAFIASTGPGALAEYYGAPGAQTASESSRAIADWAAAQGCPDSIAQHFDPRRRPQGSRPDGKAGQNLIEYYLRGRARYGLPPYD